MQAEEAKDPKRTIPKAYISGILTLVLLALGVMIFAGGVGDWTVLSNINDPLIGIRNFGNILFIVYAYYP